MLRRIDGFLAALLLVGLAGASAWLDRPERLAGAVRAIDGDTLELAGRRVRLVGIDAPELGQVCGETLRPVRCGADAREELRRLVAGDGVECRVSGRDRWARDLATCRAGESDLGAAMVRAGHAVAAGRYAAEEREAREARLGIWAGPFELPSVWRQAHRS